MPWNFQPFTKILSSSFGNIRDYRVINIGLQEGSHLGSHTSVALSCARMEDYLHSRSSSNFFNIGTSYSLLYSNDNINLFIIYSCQEVHTLCVCVNFILLWKKITTWSMVAVYSMVCSLRLVTYAAFVELDILLQRSLACRTGDVSYMYKLCEIICGYIFNFLAVLLQGIGLSLEEALIFWRAEFTKLMDVDKVFYSIYFTVLSFNWLRGLKSNRNKVPC